MLATLSTTRTENLLADGVANASALTSGYQLAFGIGAGLVAAAIAFAVTVLPSRTAQQPETVAEPDFAPGEPAYQDEAA